MVTNTYFILYLPSPFDAKILNDNKQKERLEFYSYAITQVKNYLKRLKTKTIKELKINPGLMLTEISKVVAIDENFTSHEEEQEFEETIGFLLIRLLNQKEITCDNNSIHPRKRKFFAVNT